MHHQLHCAPMQVGLVLRIASISRKYSAAMHGKVIIVHSVDRLDVHIHICRYVQTRQVNNV